MNTTVLVILVAAIVLLYGAVKNKNPLDIIKGALKLQAPANAAPLKK